MLTERDILVLLCLFRYYVLSRSQIQRLCFPGDITGRVTRRRLQTLIDTKLIQRQPVLVVHPGASSAGPVYFSSPRGLQVLADYHGDERFLAGTCRAPQDYRLLHWLAVSETHITLDAALALHPHVKCLRFFNEWDVVNPDETEPQHRFRLYLLIHESPRLVCAPDAAFLLEMDGHRKAFYVEQDRNTSGTRQIAASKTKGYAVMAEQSLHRKHFPDETVGTFSVLTIAPDERRRDALCNAIKDKPGAELWKFASVRELTPETFFHAPVFRECKGDTTALMKPPLAALTTVELL
jgi:hypothetical protein